MKILLTGYGDIARRLVNILIPAGHEIVGLRRKTETTNIPILSVDLRAIKQLDKIAYDFDIVVVTLTPDQPNPTDYHRTYIDCLANLLTHFSNAQSSENKLPFFIFVSSTSVYEQNNGEYVDETSLTNPKQFKGQTLVQAEQLLLQSDIFKSCIVRFSGIYGRNNQNITNKLQNSNQSELSETLIETGNKLMNRVHVDDCVNILSFLIQRYVAGKPLAAIYLASDNRPCLQIDLYKYLAEELKLDIDFNAIKSKISNQATGKRCDNKLLKQLGYEFIYPSYIEGYKIK